MKIRLATPEDAQSIAQVHTRSWLNAFQQFAPAIAEARKEQLSERLRFWRDNLQANKSFVYVMVDDEDTILGFAEGGTVSDALGLPYDGELLRLYIAPEQKNKGIGKQLINRVARHLQETGKQSLVVLSWSVNRPARKVYEHLGAKFVKEITQEKYGFDASQTVYVWEDIQSVIEATQ